VPVDDDSDDDDDFEEEAEYDEEDEDQEVDFLAEEDEQENEDYDGPSKKLGGTSLNRAEFLSGTEIRHLTAAFEVSDRDETGELGFAAFMKALALMGKKVTKAEAQEFFDAMDVDKSGFITIDEWIGFYANHMVNIIFMFLPLF
jgi:hypothetical protein